MFLSDARGYAFSIPQPLLSKHPVDQQESKWTRSRTQI
jgi:hypothetical protein